MSEQTKPREWKIQNKGMHEPDIAWSVESTNRDRNPRYNITADEFDRLTKVIEKSAFDAQALEIEKLKKELEAVKEDRDFWLEDSKKNTVEYAKALARENHWKSRAEQAISDAAIHNQKMHEAEFERDRLQAELEAVRDKYEELTSYMPKIPTEPYEKRLARECRTLQSRVEKLKGALEFYAQNEHWQSVSVNGLAFNATFELGDKARVALAEDAKLESESAE